MPFLNDSLGKLFLRLGVGGLMLFHGVAKVTGGVAGIKALFMMKGIPTFVAYGAYLGEFVAAIMVLVGFYTRIGAILIAGTMAVVIFTAHAGDIFTLTKHGAWGIELPMFYILGALAIFFLGAGKYSVDKDRNR